MSLRTHALAFALAIAAAASGCTRSELRDAGGRAVTQGSMQVQLTFTRIGPGQDARDVQFDGQAHFARYAATDAELVPTLLGVASDDDIPLDTCRAIDSADALDRALDAVDPTVGVELLDAGRLAVRGPDDATALVAKHYPELTPYVAGVVYGADDALPLALEPGAVYEVAGEGGEEIGPFQVQAQAPRAFPSLEAPVLRRGSDLELRWTEAGEVSEPMVLVVAWSARAGVRGGVSEVRCRVRDDGSFAVPRELLAAMPAPSRLTGAEVSAQRTRRSSVAVLGARRGSGFERFDGALRVVLREVVPLPVSAWPLAGTGGAVPSVRSGAVHDGPRALDEVRR